MPIERIKTENGVVPWIPEPTATANRLDDFNSVTAYSVVALAFLVLVFGFMMGAMIF